MSFGPLVSLMQSSRLYPRCQQIGFVPIFIYLLIKFNRPSPRIGSFLIVWLTHMKLFGLLIVLILKRYSSSLNLRRVLILYARIFYLPCSKQEALDTGGLDGSNIVCHWGPLPFLSMANWRTIFIVAKGLGKGTPSYPTFSSLSSTLSLKSSHQSVTTVISKELAQSLGLMVCEALLC